MSKAAVEFLQTYGDQALISLGCGETLNRLDNHLKLLLGCKLKYYVGIDRIPSISFDFDSAFINTSEAKEQLNAHYREGVERFLSCVRVFPSTYIEELAGIFCKVVVCQRVLPFRRLEKVISSMNPQLILQEDLIGCELQKMDRARYKKSYPGIMYYQLKPFRPTGFIPAEKNLVLWRRRDYYPCQEDSWPLHKRVLLRLLPKKMLRKVAFQ